MSYPTITSTTRGKVEYVFGSFKHKYVVKLIYTRQSANLTVLEVYHNPNGCGRWGVILKPFDQSYQLPKYVLSLFHRAIDFADEKNITIS